jgi:hypothetical protein
MHKCGCSTLSCLNKKRFPSMLHIRGGQISGKLAIKIYSRVTWITLGL